MSERIAQSVAKLVVFRAYLASDGKTPATGKTIAVTISKNGAVSFSNPAAGATNATEMASGYYKFTLASGDTDTTGPLAWRGAEGTIDDAGDVYSVENANNGGFAGLPDAVAGAAGGLSIVGSEMSLSEAMEAELVASVFSRAMAATFGSLTFDQVLRVLLAASAGKVSGANTNAPVFRNLDDSANVIVATTDVDGNRTAVTLTPG